ncbi:MAG: hypothetical protein VW258_12540, partial [Thalassolituus sp.]
MGITELTRAIRADIRANIYVKSMVVLVMYRIAHYFFSKGTVGKVIGAPVIVLYHFISAWILG